MKVLRLLSAWICHEYYCAASRQIDPMHPDVGRVLQHRVRYEDKLRSLYA